MVVTAAADFFDAEWYVDSVELVLCDGVDQSRDSLDDLAEDEDGGVLQVGEVLRKLRDF